MIRHWEKRTCNIKFLIQSGEVFLSLFSHWYDSRPMTYTLGAKGENLLATHEQEVKKEHQRMANVRAEQERQRVESDKESSKKRRFDLFSAIIGSVIGSVITIVGEIVIRLIFK